MSSAWLRLRATAASRPTSWKRLPHWQKKSAAMECGKSPIRTTSAPSPPTAGPGRTRKPPPSCSPGSSEYCPGRQSWDQRVNVHHRVLSQEPTSRRSVAGTSAERTQRSCVGYRAISIHRCPRRTLGADRQKHLQPRVPSLLAVAALSAGCKKHVNVGDELLPRRREREQVPTLEQYEASIRDT